ncbi:hypothetical protein F7725_024885 [Dissostichus mawsoni]|uniref:Uncharacterized protein n=1 Tax=Dissostichus mawsoni TaxID=36200 RepID=A0A7J5X9S5_DISMA|nr:hypothetical protein F7725_024885 [Dissostichus mawsoni]
MGEILSPEIVSMQVVGVVEGTSCPWDQLVLMICEDGKLYAYDEEELHLVASSLKQLDEEGIEYPASKTYYKGEAFKDMTMKDWEKVWNSPTGRKLDREHRKEADKAKAEAEAKAQAVKAEARKKIKEEFLNETRYFRHNAAAIIKKMKELNDSRQGRAKLLVDEILHSIFFLGRINTPPISPGKIVKKSKMLKKLKKEFPRPFELYSSELPRRTPFSCLLDMIVFLKGRQNENEIKQKLQELIRELHPKASEPPKKKKIPLVSSTICVSQKNPKSEKYYGVSMSASGKLPGRIMVAASCLPGSWDSYVAGAVMTFNPEDKSKKSYFDGTIQLPQPVTCQAFSLHGEGAQKLPCTSCANLFRLRGNYEVGWPYGNCAEVESVSNLFKKDTEVREQARPTSEKFTTENRSKAEESVREDLRFC